MKSKEQSRLIAALYTRLSDDDEKDGTSVSIETQEKILTDFCKQNNICIYDVYIDDGYTGTNFNRPDLKRMMEDVKAKRVNVVIVKDLSRFGRNYLQVGSYISDIFPQMNVRFIAIGDDVDTDRGDTDYDLMLPIKNVFNEYYPADCSRKTKQAFITKAMNGEYIGSFAVYGLLKSQDDHHVFEINQEVAPNVIWIFEMAAYHGYGYNKIARVLKEHKILEAKIAELDRKFEQLYDDRFNGILSDRKFQDLSARCEAEQDAARARRAELVKIQDSSQATAYGTERFLELAESYETLTELDDEVLNRLIRSVVVGDRIKENGTTMQNIKINYKFIGEIA